MNCDELTVNFKDNYCSAMHTLLKSNETNVWWGRGGRDFNKKVCKRKLENQVP